MRLFAFVVVPLSEVSITKGGRDRGVNSAKRMEIDRATLWEKVVQNLCSSRDYGAGLKEMRLLDGKFAFKGKQRQIKGDMYRQQGCQYGCGIICQF